MRVQGAQGRVRERLQPLFAFAGSSTQRNGANNDGAHFT